jgi:hypothetical protein
MYYYWQRLRQTNSVQALSQTSRHFAGYPLANPIF